VASWIITGLQETRNRGDTVTQHSGNMRESTGITNYQYGSNIIWIPFGSHIPYDQDHPQWSYGSLGCSPLSLTAQLLTLLTLKLLSLPLVQAFYCLALLEKRPDFSGNAYYKITAEIPRPPNHSIT